MVSWMDISIDPGSLRISIFLEGTGFNGAGEMNNSLNANGRIPLEQPYRYAPWSYAGTERVNEIPAGVVDWVLVELRDAITPEAALPSTVLAGWPKAMFLKSDGTLIDINGTSLPHTGPVSISHNLYIVIRHRNHLAVMSASGAEVVGGILTYDFTTGISKAFGGEKGYKHVVTGFAMVSGDIDQDGRVFVSDYNRWATNFGSTSGYFIYDLDMDSNVFVSDFNLWAGSFGSEFSGTLKSIFVKPKYISCVPK